MQDTGEKTGPIRRRSSASGRQGHPRSGTTETHNRRARRRGRVARTKSPPRMVREMTLEIAAMEYVWLWDRRHGSSIQLIAAREGVSVGRVRFGLARARAQERGTVTTRAVRPPRLVPLFPIGPYTPQSQCAHLRPIEPGSSLCCMVCHKSGMDRHPALRRDPRAEPAAEPKPRPVPAPAPSRLETRKERRQRLFGARA
jgi:hypothetical protein